MKWGVRRYQNYDGTLTEAGKDRYMKDLRTDGTLTKYGRNKYSGGHPVDLKADSEKTKKAYSDAKSAIEQDNKYREKLYKNTRDKIVERELYYLKKADSKSIDYDKVWEDVDNDLWNAENRDKKAVNNSKKKLDAIDKYINSICKESNFDQKTNTLLMDDRTSTGKSITQILNDIDSDHDNKLINDTVDYVYKEVNRRLKNE